QHPPSFVVSVFKNNLKVSATFTHMFKRYQSNLQSHYINQVLPLSLGHSRLYLCESCTPYNRCTSMSLYTVTIQGTKNVSIVTRGLPIFVLDVIIVTLAISRSKGQKKNTG